MKKKKILYVLAAGALTASFQAVSGLKPIKGNAGSGSLTYLDKNFKTDGIEDATASNNITLKTGDGDYDYGVCPTDGAAASHITYKVTTKSASNVFDSMQISLNDGRFAYYAGDFGNYFDFYVSDSETLPSSKTYTIAGTGEAKTSITYDFSDAVKALNTSVVYVSFGFSPKNAGCGYDVTWTIFNKMTITGTEEEPASSDTITNTISDNWRNGSEGSVPASNKYNADSIYGLGGDGNTTHGAIVGTWGGSLSVTEGQNGWVQYKLGVDNAILQSGSLKFVVKFNNMGNGDIHNGDRLFVKASVTGDDSDFTEVAKYRHGSEEGWIDAGNSDEYTQTVDLTSFITGLGKKTKYIYVRFQMMHYLALSNVELAAWGTKMFETSVTYTSRKAYFIDYNLDEGTLPEDSEYAFYEDDETYTLPTPTKTGYEFKGWKDSDNNIVTTFDPSLKQGLSVTAIWELESNSHSITYIGADGATNTNPIAYEEGGETINLTDLSKDGYTFLGFYDAETGGNKITTIDPTTATTDIVLYARWAENEYDISYDIPDDVTLSADGKETLPTKVKYTETINYTITAASGKGIAKLLVDGVLVDPTAGFTLSGSEKKAHTVKVETYTTNNVATKVEENYSEMDRYDYSFADRAYDYSNISIKRDGVPGSGLSKVKEEEGLDTYITYKFLASEGKKITKVKLSGLARIFDYYGNDAKFVAYTSIDNATWKALKEYSPTSLVDGDETVSLDYSKAFDEGVDTLYVKIVWDCTSGGSDWVVLKKLGIEVNETEIVPPTPEPSSSEEPTSSSETSQSSGSNSGTSSTDSKTDGGDNSTNNVGLVVGIGAGAAALILAGVIAAIIAKRKKDAK